MFTILYILYIICTARTDIIFHIDAFMTDLFRFQRRRAIGEAGF